MGAGRETMKMRWKCHAKPMRNDLKSDEKLWEIHRIGGKMTAKLWEMQFSILFLIVLYRWSTVDYHAIYENMRNENWKSFAGRNWGANCKFVKTKRDHSPKKWKHHFQERTKVQDIKVHIEKELHLFKLLFSCSEINQVPTKLYDNGAIPYIIENHIIKNYIIEKRYRIKVQI